MNKTHEKFMVLESKATGKRCIVGSDFPFDKNLYEVCAYGPTRQSCYVALFYMKPSTHSS